jgi:hypothetical protein
MLFQTGSAATGAPFACTEFMDATAQIQLANAAVLQQGAVVCRDITQIVGLPGLVGTSATASQTDQVLLPASANAGRIFGVYQGPTITNATGSPVTYTLDFRKIGPGLVYAAAVSAGTAITIGANLIAQPTTSSNVIVGAFATGKEVGMVIATPINTTVALAIATGSQTVTPASMVGISTSTPLVIDSASSGVQETVTPSAITTTTFTATFAKAHGAGATVVGQSTAVGASLIPVPGSGTTYGTVYADIQVE